MADERAKAKSKRTALRNSVIKFCTKIENWLNESNENINVCDLEEWLEQLIIKSDELNLANLKVEKYLKSEEYDAEFESIKEYSEKISKWKLKAKKRIDEEINLKPEVNCNNAKKKCNQPDKNNSDSKDFLNVNDSEIRKVQILPNDQQMIEKPDEENPVIETSLQIFEESNFQKISEEEENIPKELEDLPEFSSSKEQPRLEDEFASEKKLGCTKVPETDIILPVRYEREVPKNLRNLMRKETEHKQDLFKKISRKLHVFFSFSEQY